MSERKAIVIGASRGIGAAVARELLRRGFRVAVVARDAAGLDQIAAEFPGKVVTRVHDVRRTEDVPTLFVEFAGELGGLDAVFYVAGVMPPVGPDEFDTGKDLEMVDTNFRGAVAWLNEAASRFQGTRRGTIVGVGSVAGDRGRRGQPVYNASKAALATYLEALRNRLSGLGVAVTTIKPGPVATAMTQDLGLKKAMPVEVAARRIVDKMDRGTEVYLEPLHRVIFAVIRAIPSGIFRRLPI